MSSLGIELLTLTSLTSSSPAELQGHRKPSDGDYSTYSLPFPEAFGFPPECQISRVLHLKNKNQSLLISVPKSKSIRFTALKPF